MIWTLYFDGLTEPVNPGGVMGWAFILNMGPDNIASEYAAIPAHPSNTNNTAEGLALQMGLRRILAGDERPTELRVYGDSQLILYQLTGKWKCNPTHLIKIRDNLRELLAEIGAKWMAEWVPREENAEADALSKKAYFEATGKHAPERGKKT